MPERERAMFLLLGYAANQVAFYTKLAILSTNYESADAVENTLSAAQSLMIVRTVAGILHETWDGIIRKHFLSSPDSRQYFDGMDERGEGSAWIAEKAVRAVGVPGEYSQRFCVSLS